MRYWDKRSRNRDAGGLHDVDSGCWERGAAKRPQPVRRDRLLAAGLKEVDYSVLTLPDGELASGRLRFATPKRGHAERAAGRLYLA